MIVQPADLQVGTTDHPDRVAALIDRIIKLELPVDPAAVERVTKDLVAEGFDPKQFDVRGLTAEIWLAADGRHLDTVSDEIWNNAVASHRRAPFPVAVA